MVSSGLLEPPVDDGVDDPEDDNDVKPATFGTTTMGAVGPLITFEPMEDVRKRALLVAV